LHKDGEDNNFPAGREEGEEGSRVDMRLIGNKGSTRGGVAASSNKDKEEEEEEKGHGFCVSDSVEIIWDSNNRGRTRLQQWSKFVLSP
jgi:hypothetical protein